MPKPALWRCTGTACPTAPTAAHGRSSAATSRHSGPVACGAMPRPVICPAMVYGAAIDGALLQELIAANYDKPVIAFTHKPVLGNDPVIAENRRLIAMAVEAGFTVNLSADNPDHADHLAALGIAPVVTVLARACRAIRHRFKRQKDLWAETIGGWRDRTASLPRHTPAGRRIAICPATYSDATCKSCGICARVRDAVIGFPAHGAWRKVEKAIAARDVPVGQSWAFRDHRTMAQIIAAETPAA